MASVIRSAVREKAGSQRKTAPPANRSEEFARFEALARIVTAPRPTPAKVTRNVRRTPKRRYDAKTQRT